MMSDEREDIANGRLRRDRIWQKPHGDLIQKLLLGSHFVGHARRNPSFKVDAAYDDWELGTKVCRLLDR